MVGDAVVGNDGDGSEDGYDYDDDEEFYYCEGFVSGGSCEFSHDVFSIA